MTLRSLAAAFIFLATMPGATSAQEPPRSPVIRTAIVGSRVRVRTAIFPGRPQGMVAALDDSELTLVLDGGGLPVKIPVASITALDQSLGRKRRTLEGLGIGVASGALLGLAFPVDPYYCGTDSENFCSRGEAVAAGTFLFGLIGTLVGAAIVTDRWAPVTLSVTRPQTAPGHSGVGVAFTVRF